MKDIAKKLFDISGITLYIVVSFINFFWYMLIGEDTELNTRLTYISYIGFYIGFSFLLFLFLAYSKSKASKIIFTLLGVITTPLWIAGYMGAAGVVAPEPGLVNTRLIVLIVNSSVTLYAILRLFKRDRGGQCHIT